MSPVFLTFAPEKWWIGSVSYYLAADERLGRDAVD
jgi:hypothetical protein